MLKIIYYSVSILIGLLFTALSLSFTIMFIMHDKHSSIEYFILVFTWLYAGIFMIIHSLEKLN